MNGDRRFVEERRYNIQSLWERHHNAIRLIALGHGNKEIAEVLEVTPQTISNIRNSPIAKSRIEQFREMLDAETLDINRRIQEFAPVALELIEGVISGDFPEAPIALRAKHAAAHLARAGYGEVKKIASINTYLSREDIERIKERAVASARDAGMLAEE